MIETPRLRLRMWQEKDFAPFAAMNADPEVMEFFPACMTEDETRAFIQTRREKFEKYGFGLMAAEIKESSTFIGFVGLNVPDFILPFTPCVEIGWRLAKPHWGMGYATEAARATLSYAFETLALPQVLSWTYRGNTRSSRVMERIGMTHWAEQDFEHPLLPEGDRLRPHVIYRMTREDYAQLPKSMP